MKNFYAKLKAKSEDAEIKEISGTTSNAAKRTDVTAWLNRNYPGHTVVSIRLTSKEVTE